MNKKQYTTDAYGRSVDKRRTLDEEPIHLGRAQKSYERFFEGYTEYRAIGRAGGVIRVYTGDLFHQDMTEKQARNDRIRFGVVSAAAIALYIAAIVLPVRSNNCWYAALTSLIPAIFYTQLLLSAGLYCTSAQDLKIREYREITEVVPRVAFRLLVSLVVAFIGTVCMLVLIPGSWTGLEVVRFLLLAVSGATVQLLSKAQSNVSYTIKPGKKVSGKGAVHQVGGTADDEDDSEKSDCGYDR